MTHIELAKLIQKHKLPPTFIDTVNQWYRAIARNIAALYTGKPLVIGVQGLQGSGKSTFACFLQYLLGSEHSLTSVSLSLDDFYLTRSERHALSVSTHPLLETRGVPGTHDVSLAINTIKALLTKAPEETVYIPRFNKATDDRHDKNSWDAVSGDVNVVIFEGWCVGVCEQDAPALSEDMNSLERDEDSTQVWRHYVNKQLEKAYADLFDLLNYLVVIAAPSFECVHAWRWLQEQKMHDRYRQEGKPIPSQALDENGVARFIAHYERLSRHAMKILPEKADWLLTLNTDHAVTHLKSSERVRFLNDQVSR